MQIKNVAAVTHSGRRRKRNEDAVLQIPEVPFYAVADGSGDPRAAEAALNVLRENMRHLATQVKAIGQNQKSATRLGLGAFFDDVFHDAGDRVSELGSELGTPDLGAALLTATLADRFAYFAHVGNVRAYLLRDNELWQLTTDHTFAMTSLLKGDIDEDDYITSPFKYTLTQALGVSARMDVEFAEVWLKPGDVLLMCTDGLFRVVDDLKICEILATNPPRAAARSLVQAALDADTPDNISVVVFDLDHEESHHISTADIAETLRDVFLFRELTEADRMNIAPYFEEVFLDPGEVVCAEGEVGDSFYVVIEGEVKVTRKRTTLTTIGRGGNFGEIALVGTGRRTATVAATERTRLFELSAERFNQLMRSKPSMASRLVMPLLTRLGARVQDLTERLATFEEERGRS